MKIHEGNFNTYYQVKEANLNRLYSVWFQIYEILEKAKLWSKKISDFQGLVGQRDE